MKKIRHKCLVICFVFMTSWHGHYALLYYVIKYLPLKCVIINNQTPVDFMKEDGNNPAKVHYVNIHGMGNHARGKTKTDESNASLKTGSRFSPKGLVSRFYKTNKGLEKCVVEHIDKLVKEKYLAPENIVLIGNSRGCYTTMAVAKHYEDLDTPLNSVFMRNPVKSLRSAMKSIMPLSGLLPIHALIAKSHVKFTDDMKLSQMPVFMASVAGDEFIELSKSDKLADMLNPTVYRQEVSVYLPNKSQLESPQPRPNSHLKGGGRYGTSKDSFDSEVRQAVQEMMVQGKAPQETTWATSRFICQEHEESMGRGSI